MHCRIRFRVLVYLPTRLLRESSQLLCQSAGYGQSLEAAPVPEGISLLFYIVKAFAEDTLAVGLRHKCIGVNLLDIVVYILRLMTASHHHEEVHLIL